MSFTEKLPKYFVFAALAGGLGIFVYQNFGPSKGPGKSVSVNVRVPELSPAALQGKTAFDANCAACHGVNGAGTNQGPPFIHNTYNPGHHADLTFFRAVELGVRGHHWRYGNMPPQPQVTKNQVAAIVKYVRELQAANGITYKPDRM